MHNPDSLKQLYNKAQQCHLPFVVYMLPAETKFSGMIQTELPIQSNSNDFDLLKSKGFVFAPAAGEIGYPTLCIKPDIVFNTDDLDQINLSAYKPDSKEIIPIQLNKKRAFTEVGKNTYSKQVENIKKHIDGGYIEKAILSRIKQVDLPDDFHPINSFLALAKSYPNVMVYLVYLPGVGVWMGATPEVLLQIKNNVLKNVSLAGTQANTGIDTSQVVWGEKEKDEQLIVTGHIQRCFAKHFSESPAIEGPFTVSTGPLLHLKTTFHLNLKEEDKYKVVAFLKSLHPTPAIAGQPRGKALDIIKQTEQHSRAYYTGHLGPVNMNGATHLFVNLRCMQIIDGTGYLYLGGGITADSDAEAEWSETELKATTLLYVLENK